MESSKGNDALLTATKVTEFNINHGGYIPVTFGILLLAGCAAAYAIAVTRGNVEAILPLISDAAGSPPQNGIFGTLICIGGMFGVLFMIQRYMIVSEKNRDMSKLVGAVNKLCLCAGIVSMLGITLVTGYPLNFYRNRDIWLRDVGIPHMIGGVILFSLGLVYLGLQCAITLLLKTKNECTLTIRVLLFLACAVAFVYHMMTVPDNFSGISHMYYMNSTDVDTNTTNLLPYPSTLGVDLKLPIDMDGSYFTSAVAEWAFVICFCFFFFTFYSETQEYSLQIIIETHTTHGTEVSDEPKIDFRKASVHQQVSYHFEKSFAR
ncbi:DNA damage-regulated autophagy modulator protein 1 [Parasteatoda tepidariorum]|uniref:DNA damage-regulated autophagy modulator protein 1 n=1 Tax=Parasteatoda tepidariorum TaxID=114398 RepID=UPI001C72396D|nr:DNA damage-regulated autophagy modulator protein 1 [Parasteatoda tepidariorum]